MPIYRNIISINIRRATCILLSSVFASFAYASALVASGEYPYRLFDGDFVHPHVLVRDLASGGSLYEWNSSAALYAFPDWLFALTALVPIDSRVAALCSSLLLLGAFAFLGGNLIRIYMSGLGAAGGIILYGSLLVITTMLAGLPIQWLLNYAASLYIHTGAALMVMASVWMGRNLLSGKYERATTGALSIIGAATIYSDPVYLPWFTAPLLVAALLVALCTHNMKILIGPLIVTAVSLLAWLAEKVKPFPSASASLYSVDPITAALEFSTIVFDGLVAGDAAILLYLLAVFWSGILLLRTSLALFRTGVVVESSAQNLLMSLSTLSVLLLPIAVGAIDHPSKLRYMIALVYLAPVLLVQGPLTACQRLQPRRLVVGGAVLLGLVTVLLSPGLAKAFRQGQHSELISCLSNRGLKDGYAEYSFAKPVTFLTDGRIHLVQLGSSATTNFSRRWRTQRIDGTPFLPNFVITGNLSQDDLQRFGAPDEILRCSQNEVWVFSQPLPIELAP